MSLGIDPSKSPRRELVALILRQLDTARELLSSLIDDPIDLEHNVHAVRKRCKEVRGLAELVRIPLDDHAAFDAQEQHKAPRSSK